MGDGTVHDNTHRHLSMSSFVRTGVSHPLYDKAMISIIDHWERSAVRYERTGGTALGIVRPTGTSEASAASHPPDPEVLHIFRTQNNASGSWRTRDHARVVLEGSFMQTDQRSRQRPRDSKTQCYGKDRGTYTSPFLGLTKPQAFGSAS